jgi:hypothetical protein
MNISGNTVLLVNGKPSRVCGSRFNHFLRLGRVDVRPIDDASKVLVPSKNLGWSDVARIIRAGKKAVAKTI